MRIAHFGTFDVDNYGDLLFPHLFEWRLPSAEVTHVSPTGGGTQFRDARPSINFAEARAIDVDAVVVGGGNIVNLGGTRLAQYEGISRIAYAGLWLGAADLAAGRGVPLAFNGPSISRAEPRMIERRLLRDVISGAAYAAFRDEESVRNAQLATASLVPDTAFDLARMWPLPEGNSEPPTGSIAVHVNRRYVSSIAATATVLDEMATNLGGQIRLIPIGPCHGDIETANALAGAMKAETRVEPVTTLRAMAHTIGSSELYIGSSMHGFITSLAYGRRAALVLNDKPMAKFLGVLESAGLSRTAIYTGWDDALRSWPVGASMSDDARAEIYRRLDGHWEQLRLGLSEHGSAPKAVGNWKLLTVVSQLEDLALRASRRLGSTIGSAKPNASVGRG